MQPLLPALFAGALLLTVPSVEAGHKTFSYPKVRTFTGGYYGPSQAHYQYQRRYGRPWHGVGGLTTGYHAGHRYGASFGGRSYSHNYGWPSFGNRRYGFGFPYSLGSLGYSSYYSRTSLFGPSYGCFSYGAAPLVSYPLGASFYQPSLVLQSPGVYTPFFSTNPLVNDALLNNGYQWQQEVPGLITPHVKPLHVEPQGDGEVLPPPPPSPAAQLRSLQHQQRGDTQLAELNYLQAYVRYQNAIKAAATRVEPHYRMGIALAGMKRFDKAVRELKTATDLDPSWVESVSLQELLGEDNIIGKVQLKTRVAEWALEDAYDADRMYLLGTLLYLDDDRERARILFETAAALIGHQQHLAVFLSPAVIESSKPPLPSETVAPQEPPTPELPPLPIEPKPSATSFVLPGPVFPSSF